MVNTEDKLLVEHYLDGSLPDNDLRILRTRLEKEDELSRYAEQQRELRAFHRREELVGKGMDYLMALPEATSPDPTADSPKPVESPATPESSWIKWLIVLFIVLGVLALAYFLTQPAGPHIIDHRPIATVMADAPPPAATAFNQGKYAEAIPLLRTAVNEEFNPDYQLALVISLLETGEPDEALSELERLNDAPRHEQAVLFYRAYALWQLGRNDEARENLDKLPTVGYYAKPASNLLLRLK